MLFTDTKTEDEDLYRFLDDAEKALGCELVRVAEGRDIWQVFNDVRMVGNTRLDPCSRVLKREVAARYIKEHKDINTVVFGIDAFEAHRTEAIIKNYAPIICEFPLIDSPMGHDQKLSILEADGIKAPRLYAMGFDHNNCGGFCVKAGQAHFATLYRAMPDRYEYHAAKEREAIASGIKHRGIIRVVKNRKKRYLTLDQFKAHINADLFDKYDTRGCGCFSGELLDTN